MNDVEMIIVNGVRYRREDAVKLGILGPAAVTPARHLHGESAPEEPEAQDIASDTGEQVAEPAEEEESESASEEPEEVEEDEDGAEHGGDASTGKPSGTRRKAPRRAN